MPERAGRQPSWAGSTRSSPRKVWASQYYKLGDSSRHQLLLQPLLPPSRLWIERPEVLPRPSAAAPDHSGPHWDQKVSTAALVWPSSLWQGKHDLSCPCCCSTRRSTRSRKASTINRRIDEANGPKSNAKPVSTTISVPKSEHDAASRIPTTVTTFGGKVTTVVGIHDAAS